ncbi:hypothetical protein BH23BAC2_BH23BAC2_04910 [soil metagenome]
MKKLVLTFAAIGLFFTGTQAQVVAETTTTTEVTTTNTVVADDDYVKIELVELPAAVTAAITRDFAGATATEAWVKEKESKVVYKLKVNVNGEEKKLYADAEGNWIDKKDKKDKKDGNKDS